MVDYIGNLENIDKLYGAKIVLYGAGCQGEIMFNLLTMANMRVEFFCDGNRRKHGASVNGAVIISPSELKQLDSEEDVAIVIAVENPSYVHEIAETIERLGLRTKIVYTPMGIKAALTLNLNHPKMDDRFRILFSAQERLRRIKIESSYLAYSRIQRYFVDPPALLVYSPLKNGTSSVHQSITRLGYECQHIHFFRNPEHEMRNCPPDDKAYFERSYSDEFLACAKKRRTKVITLVRDPLARILSGIFQTLDDAGFDSFLAADVKLMDAFDRWIKERIAIINSAPKDPFGNLYHYFMELFLWFDEELKSVFGIDVFAHPFDRERGYTLIRQGNIEVLVMKLEKLGALESVIGEFVGAPDFKLININEADRKMYKYIYRQVREKIKIPRELASYYFDNPRMDHFYTEEEKTAFLEKWERNMEA